MNEYTLRTAEDRETGETGLSWGLSLDYPTVASEGLLVAHDIIEHPNGLEAIGTIADELQALSGVWLTRATHGQMRRDRIGSAVAPDDSVWSEVQNMGRMVWCGYASLIMRDHTELNDPYDSTEWAESFLNDPEALADFIERECDERPTVEWVEQYLSTVRYHLIKGEIAWREKFKVAIERFGEFAIHSFFWDVADAIHPYTQYECYEGVTLKIDFDHLTVEVEEVEPEWDEGE